MLLNIKQNFAPREKKHEQRNLIPCKHNIFVQRLLYKVNRFFELILQNQNKKT